MVSSLLDAGQHIDDTPADLTIRLTIVDNGTEPARVDALAEQYGDQLQIRVLRPGENIGYGRVANLGLDGTIEPWVCVANPDTVFNLALWLGWLLLGNAGHKPVFLATTIGK